MDIKKQQIEYLIRKVSLGIFLKDQLEISENRILEISEENKELKKLIAQRNNIIEQLTEIEEEIEKNPNVDLINQIIKNTKERLNQKRVKRTIKSLPEYFIEAVEVITKLLIPTNIK